MNFIYFCVFFVFLHCVSGRNVAHNPFIIPNLRFIDELTEGQQDLFKGHCDPQDAPPSPKQQMDQADINRKNVVLFLAHSNFVADPDPEVMQLLNLDLKTQIRKENYARSSRFVPKRVRNMKTCEELLKLSLLSLVNYCRIGLGMTTAVASVSNDTLYAEIKMKNDLEPEQNKECDNDLLGVPKQHVNSPPTRPNEDNKNSKSVPSYVIGLDRFSDLVTDDEQRDFFKVRTKRDSVDDQQKEKDNLDKDIVGVPSPNNSFWGIMDVITDTKFSFFGRLFGNDQKSTDDSQNNDNNNNNNMSDKLGQVKDTSLFEVVRETLSSLQNKDSPYLMIVIGGEIGDLSSRDSPLTQSVKHVIESEPSNQSLFVISGMCPEFMENNTPGDNAIPMGEGVPPKTCQNISIPIYARGPNSDVIAQCSELYDVPLLIKTILKRQSPEEDERQRKKRSIINVRQAQDSSAAKFSRQFLLPFLLLFIIIYIQ